MPYATCRSLINAHDYVALQLTHRLIPFLTSCSFRFQIESISFPRKITLYSSYYNRIVEFHTLIRGFFFPLHWNSNVLCIMNLWNISSLLFFEKRIIVSSLYINLFKLYSIRTFFSQNYTNIVLLLVFLFFFFLQSQNSSSIFLDSFYLSNDLMNRRVKIGRNN